MGKKILIVEDEPIIAEDLRLTLEGIGYSVVGTFSGGRDALQAARTLAPSAVIMDIVLKNGDDGIEYTRQIQRECDVPIVYLTAHMDRGTFDRAQETYPYGYLVKPVGASELFSSIETAIHRHTLEKKLKESEHRYRLLSELVSDGASSVRIDPDGSFHLEWSTNYFREKLGYARGELASIESWARAIHRDDMPLFFRSMDLLRRGEPVSGDFRVLAKSGALHWIHATVYPEWDESQQRLCRVITAIQDVTERKSAEEALRKNEERLQLIANNMQDIICQVDREGIIVYLSPSFRQLTGFDPDEKLGTHIFDGIHPEDVGIVMDAVKKAAGDTMTGRVRYRYRHRDGHYLLLETHGRLLMGDGNEIMSAVFVARDITERAESSARIDENENFFRSLAENLPGIVYRTSLNDGSETCFYNDMLRQITGFPPEELNPGGPCRIECRIHPEDRERVACTVREALLNGTAFTIEYRFMHKDGGVRHFLERGRPVCDEHGRSECIEGIILDVTDSVKLRPRLVSEN